MVFRMIHSRRKEEAPKTAPPPVKTASKPRSSSSSSGAENKPAAEVPKVDFGFRRDFNKHYRLGRKLGQGSFGQAHVCLDLATNQQLAGKVILKKNLGTQESIDDVIREAKILQTLGQKGAHPNFIDFYGVFEDDKMVIFVLEFCTGGELLERILMKKQHSEKDARDIVRQILGVVANCHLNGVIHRDIKAQNFLFANTSANSPVKIIDFGLSDFFEPDTVFRKPVGTMLYAAPEVLQKKYGPLADLWSVGVLSFILLTGEPPFWDKTEAATRHRILHSPVQLVGGVWDRALSHRWMQQESAADVPLDYQVLNSIRDFAGQNKVRQMFMYRVAETFLDDEIRHLRDQFFAMDKDNDGCISIKEMADALRAMRTGETSQQIIPEEQIEAILEGIDVDGNGLIDYMEFIAATLQLSRFHQGNSTEWDNRTLQLFENIDKDGNGYLDPLELAHALGYGDDVQDVLAEADLNLDGVIDYDEFRTLMRKVAGIAPAPASS